MWRRIGGVLVGWIGTTMAAGILIVVLAFIVGSGGIVEADKTPTMTWLVILVLVSGIASYFAGVIARAIGKDKQTVFMLIGLMVVLTVVSLAFKGAGAEPKQPTEEQLKQMPEWGFTLMAMGEAQQNAPSWFLYGSTLVSLAGVALGGLNKGDFGTPAPAAPTE